MNNANTIEVADTQSVFHLVLPLRDGLVSKFEQALDRHDGRAALCCWEGGKGPDASTGTTS